MSTDRSINRARRAGAGLLVAALAATGLAAYPGAPSLAAAPAVHAVVPAVLPAVVADPTNLATDEDKVKAAAALGINPGIDLLVLNDQAFVLAMWRAPEAGANVKAEALRAYDDEDANAAYVFITAGIFAAAHDDAQAEIAAEQAKARRRSVAVTVGLDPRDTALIELSDLNFIRSVWERAEDGSHVQQAAQAAMRVDSTQVEWDAFLNTGAQVAAAQDMQDKIDKADAERAAKLRAEQLATAKRSLLQLLLLPVTEELINAPNRQYVLHVHNQATGAEVQLASQVALNAPDVELEKALSDFIFTGGAAANTRDEQVAAAKELAGYRARVEPIRDAARKDGFQPQLVAAAEQALADNTLVALQTFLLKGQDEARARDRRLDFGAGFEPADARPNWVDTIDSTGTGHGGMVNVGGIVTTTTKAELGVRAVAGAHGGATVLMYSGKDNSATSSYAYAKAYSLTNATVRSTTKLSYWIYPQSTTAFSQVSGSNSTCVAVDLIFGDGKSLRDSAATDQHGNRVHPAQQCTKLTLDTWNEVVVPLGTVAEGKKILKVDVGYDQPANTGGYRGYIDDLKLTDLDSTPKFRTSSEAGEPGLTWTNTVNAATNIGGVCCSLTGPELKVGAGPPSARTGAKSLLYSGKDNSATSSYAYMKAFSLTDTFVTPTTTLSYWILPQSPTGHASVSGNNSTCVAVDLLFEDQFDGADSALRDTGAKDQRGNRAHPLYQCGKLTRDTWTFISVPLGAVANGKRITQINLGYDQPANTGGYRGLIDDIRITQ